MENFNLRSKCPTCGYGDNPETPPNKSTLCRHIATAVPLRCVYAAHPAQLANWPAERFTKDGLEYRPISMTVGVPDVRMVPKPLEEGQTPPPLGQTEFVEEAYVRQETVLDEAATIAAGPLTPPITIQHYHRTCLACQTSWPELKV